MDFSVNNALFGFNYLRNNFLYVLLKKRSVLSIQISVQYNNYINFFLCVRYSHSEKGPIVVLCSERQLTPARLRHKREQRTTGAFWAHKSSAVHCRIMQIPSLEIGVTYRSGICYNWKDNLIIPNVPVSCFINTAQNPTSIF